MPYAPVTERFERLEETLRRVAQYADACNIFELGDAAVAHKLEVLQQHCAKLCRDYSEIVRTSLGRLVLSADGAASAPMRWMAQGRGAR